MPFALGQEFVILCEGRADKAFFRKLIKERNLPQFDVPFPEELDDLEYNKKPLAGVGSFAQMLRTLRGDPSGFSRLRGVLLIADSANDPNTKFNQVCDQIRKADRYGVPQNPMQTVRSSNGHPAVCVMLMPDEENQGGLETLCLKEFQGRFPDLVACVEKYLKCDGIRVVNWLVEKQDKARLQCMIAATNEDDPNKSLTYAFSASNGSPIISVMDRCFDGVERRLLNFCAAAQAL